MKEPSLRAWLFVWPACLPHGANGVAAYEKRPLRGASAGRTAWC
ncbi:hypothetical protein ACE3NQ_05085 [Paenibacillus terreus]|uniref:Uncharacterized protein n=1 Tax=Paenibacillus terreus TaxID=1387834 RepID=A0ABV5B3N7_9BACL